VEISDPLSYPYCKGPVSPQISTKFKAVLFFSPPFFFPSLAYRFEMEYGRDIFHCSDPELRM
jgi:hypothetical protein